MSRNTVALLLGAVALIAALALALVPAVDAPRMPEQASEQAPALQAPATAAPAPNVAAPKVAAPTLAAPIAPPLTKETVEIRRKDTVIAALRRHGVSAAGAHAIAGALRSAGADLRRMRPGDALELSRDGESRVVSVAYAPNAWLRFKATETSGEWRGSRSEVEPEVRIQARHAVVRESLWEAAETAKLPATVLLRLAELFESVFDFTVDTRPGDRFRLLIETRYAEGELIDHGRILAAQYINDDETLTAIGFGSAKRFSYYDLEGRSLKRAFLRSPLQFSRISSGFTYRRPHPILGGVRPHLAIDYAAPTGTPVWAVADGIVQFAGRKGGNGIQVLLRHRSGYRTYYNHLSRVARGVRPGVRVRQKQVIGFVGSTGLSTGPHLDYRVSRNGKFVNPLSERFVPGKPVSPAQRTQFLEHAQALVEQLEREAPFQL